MTGRERYLVGLLVLVTTLAIVVPVTGSGSAPDVGNDAAQVGTPTEFDGGGSGEAVRQGNGSGTVGTTAGCDYGQLYDRAIDSVVLVGHERGQGSGFVFNTSENGTVVVTNQHVVGEADEVTVAFRRGERRRGEVIGTAPGADLAAIRVTETPDYVTALSVADAEPDPGTTVAALGAPFGLRGTITHGIVSSTNRSVPTQRGFSIPNVVQTDAPINPGNSGGPLVTCDGTVVGVNTAGIPAARAENIGFAVSASLVQRVIPRLVETGEFAFPYLGVRTTEVRPVQAEEMGLENARGIMVVETIDGGPAEGVLQAADRGIRVDGRVLPADGDVILAIEGTPIRSGEDLSSFLATEARPGDTVTLTIVRDGERQQVSVQLEERPATRGQ